VQVNSFRSHAEHLQEAAHRIAAGGKTQNRFKYEKTPHRGVFLILNRKPLHHYLKRIVGQFERSLLKK
jgi:hypothetical protein